MGEPDEAVVFPLEKTVLLNAIYDVIDSLGLLTEHTNSERGVILLKTPENARLHIRVDTVFPAGDTRVGISAGEGVPSEWRRIFFDELRSTLAGCGRQRTR